MLLSIFLTFRRDACEERVDKKSRVHVLEVCLNDDKEESDVQILTLLCFLSCKGK